MFGNWAPSDSHNNTDIHLFGNLPFIDLYNDTEIYLVDNLTFYDCLARIMTTDNSQNGHSVTDIHLKRYAPKRCL